MSTATAAQTMPAADLGLSTTSPIELGYRFRCRAMDDIATRDPDVCAAAQRSAGHVLTSAAAGWLNIQGVYLQLAPSPVCSCGGVWEAPGSRCPARSTS
jgi:hypothetical protein